MAYDEELARRVREVLAESGEHVEIKMFGGLCFTRHGHMCAGILGESLMVRVNPGEHDDALRERGAREMDFTGRPMRGFVLVDAPGLRDEDDLRRWLDRSLAHVATLPPKKPKPPKPPRPAAKRRR